MHLESETSQLSGKDLKRSKEAKTIKDLARVATKFHARGVSSYCNFPEGRQYYEEALLEQELTRREALVFLNREQDLFQSLHEKVNPGAYESDFALNVRRLYLIGSVIQELHDSDERLDGKLVVDVVNVFLGLGGFELDGFEVANYNDPSVK